jgi:type VI secretion system secreted protein VgrG
MALIREARKTDFTFQVDGGPADKLRVAGFSVIEEMSRPFRAHLELASKEGEVDFYAMVGKPALLTIAGLESKRFLHGTVLRFEQISRGKDFSKYRAEVVPDIWKLSMRFKCRIFQEMTVQEIVEKIFGEAGIQSDRFEFSLSADYPKRDYCVQYRESELDFIQRLFEEEGIYYFFEHKEDGHILKAADSNDVAVPLPDKSDFYIVSEKGVISEEEKVTAFRYCQEMRSGGSSLRDFNFLKPDVQLEETEGADRDDDLQVDDYPGGFMDADLGRRLNQVRLEEVQFPKLRGNGESDCRNLVPGFRFTLNKHSRSDFNIEYLILGVQQTGKQPQVLETAGAGGKMEYSNSFHCIPADSPYRPQRKTPRPVVHGTQTAIVVGPSGEEIYTDEHGRVKVQFHWDREGQMDEKSSCWIRVSQNWAGAGWGGLILPRIGHEVIVSFLEGNPDRPIITGGVYNGVNQAPYSLPDEKTKSTLKSDSSLGGGGFNEFRFEDAKDSEEIFLHGQKDLTIVIENNESDTIKANRTISIGKNENVTIGENRTESVAKNEKITVKENEERDVTGKRTRSVGKEEAVSVGQNQTVSIGKDRSITIEKNDGLNVGGNHAVEVAGVSTTSVTKDYNLEAKKIAIEAKNEISLTTGRASILMKKNGDITIKGKKITIKGSGDVVVKGSKVAMN